MKCPICNTETERDDTHYKHAYSLACPLDRITLHGVQWDRLAAALAAAERRGFEQARDESLGAIEEVRQIKERLLDNGEVSESGYVHASAGLMMAERRIRALQPQQATK